MKRIGALAFVITVGVGALSASAQAPSVDWKVYGGVTLTALASTMLKASVCNLMALYRFGPNAFLTRR